MKLNRAYLTMAMLSAIAFVGCKNEDMNDNSFDNKIFIETENRVSTLIVKPNTITDVKTISAAIPKPAEQEIEIVYRVAPDMVDTYNMAYYDEAIMLPEANYELTESRAVIQVGGVKSTAVSLTFKDLNTIDRKKVYVVPVTIESASNIDLLGRGRTVYYQIKAGAVINVVANVKENYTYMSSWKNGGPLNNLTQLTMEAMIRVKNLDHINTIMGIEGLFLMRISDQDRDSDQIQISTSSEDTNFPAAADAPRIPLNEWTQVSLTFNTISGAYVIYINGEAKASGIQKMRPINLANQNFYIGRSYDNSRWLDGDICECRIWNVVRTPAQILSGRYDVEPSSPGLVAYWKFDEGAGNTINDHTVNGNHMTAGRALKWVKVSLPE